MTGKMERHYFDEKKELATDGLVSVGKIAMDLTGLVRSWSYEVPNLIDPSEIHEQVRVAKARLDNVRRDFEKVRWASAETELEFNDWLVKHGHPELVIG
jgi:hypothetical protein